MSRVNLEISVLKPGSKPKVVEHSVPAEYWHRCRNKTSYLKGVALVAVPGGKYVGHRARRA